jgi:hypothetical protein
MPVRMARLAGGLHATVTPGAVPGNFMLHFCRNTHHRLLYTPPQISQNRAQSSNAAIGVKSCSECVLCKVIPRSKCDELVQRPRHSDES